MIETILFFAVLIILLPGAGFFLSLGFFPNYREKGKKAQLSVFERIVLSAVLGIVVPGIFLLLENQVFGIPINFFSSIGTVIALIIISLAVFWLRKKKKK